MSSTLIKQNTTGLEEILASVKSLPEAGGEGGTAKEEQEKTIDITENGTTEVLPDEGKVLSKVNVNVDIGKPFVDTSKITNFRMFCSFDRFNDCLDLIDTSNGTNFNGMFHSCTLTTIPLLDTSKGTNFGMMFYYCEALTEIPLFETSNGTSFSSMFYSCTALKEMPSLDTSKGTNFSYMFQNCGVLTTIPPLNTSNGTNFNSTFRNCYALTTLPLLDTSKGTNFASMFSSCKALTSVALTTAKTDFATSTFTGCTALTDVTLGEGWAVSIYLNYSNNLTQESLHRMIENLADLTGKTKKTFKIGSTNLAKIDEDHKAMLGSKNWSYS